MNARRGHPLAMVVLGLAAGACREAAPTASPTSAVAVPQGSVGAPVDGHVASYVFERPRSLNPFTTTDAVARRYVHGFTHEALLDLDPATGALRGALAAEWRTADGGARLEFVLRDGVRFADGAPLTVDDVRYPELVRNGKGVVLGQIAGGLHLIERAEVEAGPPMRVVVHLRAPHFDALRMVGLSWVVPQRRWFEAQLAAVAGAGRAAPQPADEDFGALLARIEDCGPGTGPYALAVDAQGAADWRRELRLVRNPHAWVRRERPDAWRLDGIRIRYLTEPAAQFAALKDRSLDFYQLPDLDDVLARAPDLARDYRKVVYDPPNLNVYVVQWNLRRPALQDIRVRRALALLFDRGAIAQSLLHGNARAAAAFAPPGSAAAAGIEPAPFSPEQARALLRAARGDAAAPLAVTVLVPVEAPIYRQMAELAADAARRAGVQLTVQALEFRTLKVRRDQGEFDGVCINLSDQTGAADPFETFHSRGAANAMGLADEALDRLLAEARTTLEVAARTELLQRAHARIAELAPVAFLVHPRAAMLINAHFRGAEPGPLGLWPERFWMPREFQRPSR